MFSASGFLKGIVSRPRLSILRLCVPGLLAIILCPGLVLAQRPLGTDVSHYQLTINWTTVKNAGIAFAWAKATDGASYVDAYYTNNVTGAKAVGIPIGGYHFARPSDNPNITGANSADTEAAHYWHVVSNFVKVDGLSMIPMLDWEDTGATNGAGFTATQMSAWVNEWCQTISNYARAKGVAGLKPIVYTGVWYSAPSGGNSGYPGLNTAVTNWPSWIAAYPSNPDPQNGGPSSSFPWPTWNFWQYADTNASGGDSDVFKGTSSGLAAYFVGNQDRPFVTSQPSSRYGDRGGSIKLSVAAAGLAPLRYQWKLNGTNVPSATNSICALTNLQTSSAGNYTAAVTNSVGATTSAVAILTINPLFTPAFSDNFDTNSAANWTLNQSANTNTRIAFAYDYSGYGIPSAPNSTGGTTKGVKFEVNYTGAGVAALNISPVGQSFGGNYRLHYDMWINANGPFPDGGAGSTQLQTAGLGTVGNKVEWNSGNSDGVFFAIDGEGQATDTSPDVRAYIGTALQSANSGVYTGGTNTSIRRCSDVYYSNVFPGGQTPPPAQAQSGALDVGTVGFAWHNVVVNKTGSLIEWFIDGLRICSITNVSLIGSNVFVGYWDPFSSLSDNTNLSFGLVDNLRVEVPAVASSITGQPQPVAVKVTSSATFTVSATGVPAPGYQWRFSGANIAGANGSSYTRTNTQYMNAGNYSVLVTNIAGPVTSSNALLSILTATPAEFQSVVMQPDSSLQFVLQGDPGATYYVQSSTNFVNWLPVTNVTLSGGSISFNIPGTTNGNYRFFRARSGP